MKILRKGALKTRQGLLVAAAEVFSEKGYRDSTIAEICKRAGANVAAVNYYFGDKETLYREAWRNAFLESLKAHPPDGGVGEDAPAEERLRGRIGALLRRISNEDNKEFSIVYRELANPTGLLEDVMEEEIRPLQEEMEIVLRELLGEGVSDREVAFSAMSIVSQCITPMLARRFRRGKLERKDRFSEVYDIDAYVEHVVKFSLAGIQGTREEVERKRKR